VTHGESGWAVILIREGGAVQEGLQDVMLTSGSFILMLEGIVMKSYLLMMFLLVTVCMAGLSPAIVVASEPPAVKSALETIHLNQASAEQLQALPGVGPELSERIVLYRTERGPFRSVDQLTEVKGVGPAKLAKFKKS
jgi:comEA protein